MDRAASALLAALPYLPLLGELEVRLVLGAITQLDDELAAGASPGFIRLPDVGVCVGERIVGQTARTSCYCLLNGILRLAGVTGDLLRDGIARCEDGKTLIPGQTE